MNSNIGIYLACSIVIACVFQYMPMSQSLIGLKPNFLLLNTLGWIIFVPKRFGVGFSAIMGLIYDLISGSLIGINIISFTLVSAVPVYLIGWLSYFSLKQRCLFILVTILFFEAFSSFLYSFFDIPTNLVQIFFVSITSVCVWPIFDICIRKIPINGPTQHSQF